MNLLRCLCAASALFAVFVSTASGADERRPIEVSGASYTTVIDTNFYGTRNETLSGFGVGVTGAFTPNFAARGLLAFQQHTGDPRTSVAALEASLLAGQGLGEHGFKWYLGGGFFNESWSSGAGESFSGLHFTAGLGYNWNRLTLDFWLSIRDPSDYEDFAQDLTGQSVDITVVSGALALGVRF